MKSKITAVLLCVLICLSAVSCGKSSSSSSSVIKTQISGNISCLDPQIAQGANADMLIANCFEGLVRIDSSGKAVPGAAKSWKISSDGLTYTFYLRTDTHWYLKDSFSDILGKNFRKTFNTSVKADDFVFALQRAVDPQTGSKGAHSLYMIKNAESIADGKSDVSSLGVTAVDDYTLTITLKAPCADFLPVLSQNICMPCNRKFFEATAGRYGRTADLIMCNGPFYLYSWTDSDSIVLYKNNGYSGNTAVSPSGVKFFYNTDASTYTEHLTADGGYDCAHVRASDVKELEKSGLTVTKYSNRINAFLFNCNSTYLSNREMRLAIACATNTSKMGTVNAKGIVPSSCLSVSGVNYRSSAGSDLVSLYDVKSAAAHLAASGEDTSGTMSVTVITSSAYENYIKSVVQEWQKIFGIALSIKIETYSESKLESKISEGDYDIAYAPLYGDETTALDFLGRFVSDSSDNEINYSSTTYDSIIEDAVSSADRKSLESDLLKAETLLQSDAAIIPVSCGYSYYAVRNTISSPGIMNNGRTVLFASCVKK